jgi:hypothetical protein
MGDLIAWSRRHKRQLILGSLATAAVGGVLAHYFYPKNKDDDDERMLLLEGEGGGADNGDVLSSMLYSSSNGNGAANSNNNGNGYGNNNNNSKSNALLGQVSRSKYEAREALVDFLPTLRKRIESAIDVTSSVKALKKLRTAASSSSSSSSADEQDEQKQASSSSSINNPLTQTQLWENIRNSTISRLLTSFYSFNLLLCVLTAQVSILHKYPASNLESHRIVLDRTYQRFFDEGIISLAATCSAAVSKTFSHWNMETTKGVKKSDFLECFNNARQEVEENNTLTSFVIISDEEQEQFQSNSKSSNKPADDELATSILNETWDVLESPMFEFALNECTSRVWLLLTSEELDKIFSSMVTGASSSAAPEILQKEPPLASVIGDLKTVTNGFFGGKLYVEEVMRLQGLNLMLTSIVTSA